MYRARHARGMDALAEAAGGTLCVWRREQPDDFDEVAEALQGPFREGPARGVRAFSAEGERRRLADRHERPVDRPPAVIEPRPGAAPHSRGGRPDELKNTGGSSRQRDVRDRTSSTGQSECRETRSATEPSRTCRIPVRPCVPMTTRS